MLMENKDFQKTFRDKGLDFVIECNKKLVKYLEITMNLNSGSHKPYQKPDAETNYVHSESDYPPRIPKQLPKKSSIRHRTTIKKH